MTAPFQTPAKPERGLVPDYVPAHLVFDFDIYADPRVGEDVQGDYARTLEAAPELFWTPANGGRWAGSGVAAGDPRPSGSAS